jgi:hypothetical protein
MQIFPSLNDILRIFLPRRRFVKETFCFGDVLLQETFCYGDVLLRRRFVWRRFVEETFCAETFCMCAGKWPHGLGNWPHGLDKWPHGLGNWPHGLGILPMCQFAYFVDKILYRPEVRRQNEPASS